MISTAFVGRVCFAKKTPSPPQPRARSTSEIQRVFQPRFNEKFPPAGKFSSAAMSPDPHRLARFGTPCWNTRSDAREFLCVLLEIPQNASLIACPHSRNKNPPHRPSSACIYRAPAAIPYGRNFGSHRISSPVSIFVPLLAAIRESFGVNSAPRMVSTSPARTVPRPPRPAVRAARSKSPNQTVFSFRDF